LWIVALQIQRSKPYRPTFDVSQPSTRRSAWRRQHSAPPALTVTQAGHHVKTIESLELTIKANPKVIQRFKAFNNKRNKSVYDFAGAVSDQDLEAMVKLAEELKNNSLAWLRNLHPELLPGGPICPPPAGVD
jgi:hypothetical protein